MPYGSLVDPGARDGRTGSTGRARSGGALAARALRDRLGAGRDRPTRDARGRARVLPGAPHRDRGLVRGVADGASAVTSGGRGAAMKRAVRMVLIAGALTSAALAAGCSEEHSRGAAALVVPRADGGVVEGARIQGRLTRSLHLLRPGRAAPAESSVTE